MKKSLKMFISLALSASVLGLTGCGGSSTETKASSEAYTKQNPLVIKFSHVASPESPKGKAATKFAELLAEKTGGKVKVEVYPSSQLYGDKDELEAIQMGNVQIIAPSTAKLVGLNPAFQVNDLPFLFKNHEAVVKFWDGELGKSLLNSLGEKNLKGITMWELGFKHFTSNKPISKLEEFKGQKFRTQAGKVLEAQFKALSAGGATIPFGETYTALQQGTIDGQENTWTSIETQKYEEIQKYMLLSNHGRIDYIILSNKEWYDKLPEDIRNAFDDAMVEATKYQREIVLQLDKEAEDKIRKSGKMQIIELDEQSRKEFEKKMEEVYKEFEPVIGKDLIEGARNL